MVQFPVYGKLIYTYFSVDVWCLCNIYTEFTNVFLKKRNLLYETFWADLHSGFETGSLWSYIAHFSDDGTLCDPKTLTSFYHIIQMKGVVPKR